MAQAGSPACDQLDRRLQQECAGIVRALPTGFRIRDEGRSFSAGPRSASGDRRSRRLGSPPRSAAARSRIRGGSPRHRPVHRVLLLRARRIRVRGSPARSVAARFASRSPLERFVWAHERPPRPAADAAGEAAEQDVPHEPREDEAQRMIVDECFGLRERHRREVVHPSSNSVPRSCPRGRSHSRPTESRARTRPPS
jgi:hypothetical protein